MPTSLKTGELTLESIRFWMDEQNSLNLSEQSIECVQRSRHVVEAVIAAGKIVYGVNTGFGLLAKTIIPKNELNELQRKIVLSHACGVGEPLSDEMVRLILLLKINSLAQGFSGVCVETIQLLIDLFNHGVYPIIPSQGSVGASGDLAPLAHLSLVLIGEGEARFKGKRLSGIEALSEIGKKPLVLQAKEGLALLNGTQVSTGIALHALLESEILLANAVCLSALSIDAARGSIIPFSASIHDVRRHASQKKIAEMIRHCLHGSQILESHKVCEKIQDPYSLRCTPQVLGAVLSQLEHASRVLVDEANAVSDNPLVFPEQNEILSGGNFHAEPVAFAADNLAIAISEIGSLSERRIAMLTDPAFSQLPAFLTPNPGVNSGLMLAHVTAASLASENKSRAHPASVDSIPTSANQEDHVSMATFAAYRLLKMIENTRYILAIEALAAHQGIHFHAPLKTSEILQNVLRLFEEGISFVKEDRYLAPDIRFLYGVLKKKLLSF